MIIVLELKLSTTVIAVISLGGAHSWWSPCSVESPQILT